MVSYKYTANDRAALIYPNDREVDSTYHYPGGPLKALSDNGASSAIAQHDYLGGRTLVRAMDPSGTRPRSSAKWRDAPGSAGARSSDLIFGLLWL